jgi:hypothetical protein
MLGLSSWHAKEGFKMKGKLLVLVGLLFLGLVLMTPHSVNAEERVFATVSLIRILQAPAQTSIWVDEVDGVFQNTRMYIFDDHPKRKEMLAILLTAISLDKNLRIGFYSSNNEIASLGTID